MSTFAHVHLACDDGYLKARNKQLGLEMPIAVRSSKQKEWNQPWSSQPAKPRSMKPWADVDPAQKATNPMFVKETEAKKL